MEHVIIGIDVGNATTEAAMAIVDDANSPIFINSSITPTTGTKGTVENVDGILTIIDRLQKCGSGRFVIDKILLNDAAPVIADFAMETITETVITDSAMIGHNPDTPGGEGIGVGETVLFGEKLRDDKEYLVVIPGNNDFQSAAAWLNEQVQNKKSIVGAIVQKDEGTLINNRLNKQIPIVDEVKRIETVPIHMLGAVEVAPIGRSIDLLSNPYGIATVFRLDADETTYCRNIAKSLIGNRSAVVIKTPSSEIRRRVIPAGKIKVIGERYSSEIAVDQGANKIMNIVDQFNNIVDIKGEPGTNVGGMLEKIKINMSKSCQLNRDSICISDLFSVDSYAAVPIKGGIAGEYAMENGVAVAAMIHANKAFMSEVAVELEKKLEVAVEVCGIEGEMALRGVLTTPGAGTPITMVDIGAGSTDIACMDSAGQIRLKHLAGAGNLITKIIQTELNLESFEMAELIKKSPLAKIENLYKIHYENGDMVFLEEPLHAQYYGRTVTVSENMSLNIIDTNESIEKIGSVRRQAKREVVRGNILRGIKKIGINDDEQKHIILVGGTVLDFELANILTEEMDKLKITAGKGNIRGSEGPRNAVATGLIYSYYEREYGKK